MAVLGVDGRRFTWDSPILAAGQESTARELVALWKSVGTTAPPEVPLVTADLEAVTGARQALTVILPVRLLRTPTWPEGPFPFVLGSRRTDAATRATYFAPASARVLYGAPGHRSN